LIWKTFIFASLNLCFVQNDAGVVDCFSLIASQIAESVAGITGPVRVRRTTSLYYFLCLNLVLLVLLFSVSLLSLRVLQAGAVAPRAVPVRADSGSDDESFSEEELRKDLTCNLKKTKSDSTKDKSKHVKAAKVNANSADSLLCVFELVLCFWRHWLESIERKFGVLLVCCLFSF
jgi:hypothetical protein